MSNTGLHVEDIDTALTVTEFATTDDVFSLFVLLSGGASILAKETERDCHAPCAFWSTLGAPARIRLKAGSRGYLVRLPSAQIPSVLPNGQVAGFVQRSVFDTIEISLEADKDRSAVQTMLELIRSESDHKDPISAEVVRSGVTQLLCRLLRSSALLESRKSIMPRPLVHEFCQMVDQNLSAHWTVSQYAAEIGVTRDHLQSAVRRVLSKSPKEYIHSLLMDRSISLLRNSELTVSEIAYRLGFSDAGYFNRFFKRHTGLAPGRFRKQAHFPDVNTDTEPAFSSWP